MQKNKHILLSVVLSLLIADASTWHNAAPPQIVDRNIDYYHDQYYRKYDGNWGDKRVTESNSDLIHDYYKNGGNGYDWYWD